MPRLAPDQLERSANAIATHDFLHRILREIERLHRVVFHADASADWNLVRNSAEQILIAEIQTRYRGEIDGVYFALREIEDSGKTWDIAIAELAAAMHSYYTTPLGIVMRQDLFGDAAVFISPDALEHTHRHQRPIAQKES